MTLTDFLLARIAEDEGEVQNALAPYGSGTTWRLGHALDPARALAECEAKRLIVERLRWTVDHPEWENDAQMGGHWFDAHETLCDLALPYADHPDCDEEWKP